MANSKKKAASSTSYSSRRKNPGLTPAQVGFVDKLKAFKWKDFFSREGVTFVIGLCILVMSLFVLMSILSNFFTGPADQAGVKASDLEDAANLGGKLGAYTAFFFMDDCFGVFSFFIPLFFILVSMKMMRAYKVRLWKWFLNFSFLMIWGSVLMSLISGILPEELMNQLSFRLGGSHGDFIATHLTKALGLFGLWILMLAAAIIYFLYLTRETMSVIRRILHPQELIKSLRPVKSDSSSEESGQEEEYASLNLEGFDEWGDKEEEEGEGDTYFSEEGSSEQAPSSIDTTMGEAKDDPELLHPELHEMNDGETDLTIENPVVNQEAKGTTVEEVTPFDPLMDLEYYRYPTISLLKHYEDQGTGVDMAEQNANKDRIIAVLRNFGVEISNIKATIGPTITLYEVTPAPGIRINKIRNLEDDIALSLSALGIRIIAPIPGKGTIGIEVPNKAPCIVSMESIINTKKFQDSGFDLPIALGKTITNEVFMVDLAKMPHLLVAGATGQGKSVGLNAIITSLLYKKHPSELKFVMIDPKKVEFSIYAPIEKHFLAKISDSEEDPIVTDVTKVVQTLKSLCRLMDRRYDLLKMAQVRNVKEYNAKFKSRVLNPLDGHMFMPYIVVIIDEFGDLIMTAGKEVELPIARIAQLARAVGIHMIIATQRPTTNIITGTIKANFPARMAFRVMSQIDSRTILDQSGANQLIGKGDMLFLGPSVSPTRVQCAFVDTPEVQAICKFVAHQQGFVSAYLLPPPDDEGNFSDEEEDLRAEKLDPMFEEAARLIVAHQQGSTSLIQRKFSIGYNRAGRLMDQLEKMGIVGPIRGSKPREVLYSDEQELEVRLASLRR